MLYNTINTECQMHKVASQHSSSAWALLPVLGPLIKSYKDKEGLTGAAARLGATTVGGSLGANFGHIPGAWLGHGIAKALGAKNSWVQLADLAGAGIGSLAGYGAGAITGDHLANKINS